jgi:hypothetical protein
MAITRIGYLAKKRESTQGVAVVPTHFLRFKSGDMIVKQDVIVNNPIQNNRAKALNVVKGKQTIEGGYTLDLDANECVQWIADALGTLSTSDISSGTDASVYQHTITPATTIPSFTLEQAKGPLTDTSNNGQNRLVERSFGCIVDGFTISGKDNIIEMDVKVKAMGQFRESLLTANANAGSTVKLYLTSVEGLVASTDTVNIYDTTPQNETDAIAAITAADPSITIGTLGNSYTVANGAKVELVPQTPSYSVPAQLFSFGHAQIQFGADLSAAASASYENIENWDFEFSNNAKEMYGTAQAAGHFGPNVLSPLAYSCTLKYTRYFTDVKDRDAFMNITRRAAILTINNGVRISATDTNAAKYQVKINLSDLRITTHEMPTGTDELYAVTVECEAFYDASDARAVQFVVQNASAGTVYTA